MTPRPALVLVDQDGHAEPFRGDEQAVIDLRQQVRDLEQVVFDLEKDLRAKRAQITRLQRDRERERLANPRREMVVRLYDYWRERCKHKRSALTAERFDACVAILDAYESTVPTADELEALARKAIDGAAYQPFTRPRKNGTVERFDDMELIFRDGVHFERFACRAPIMKEQA